jgi:beta-galactosidase
MTRGIATRAGRGYFDAMKPFSLRWQTGVLALAFFAMNLLAADGPRERLLLDFGWKFHPGNDWGSGLNLAKAGSSRGPADTAFSDAAWRTVDLPHDWAVELPFDPAADAGHGFKPIGHGYPSNSVAWYRRTFELPKTDAGQRIWLEFDGVFRDAEVFVNGWFVGHHEGGYDSFRYDITDVARYGGKNTVAVKVDASQPEGWFYEGAGIYRHVWLEKTSPLAVAPDGVFVSTKFQDNIPQGIGEVDVQTTLANSQATDSTAVVDCQIIGPDGNALGEAPRSVDLTAGQGTQVGFRFFLCPTNGMLGLLTGPGDVALVHVPALWSPESPKLYKLITTVATDMQVVDRVETEFGIRTVAFDATNGFLLNGQPYALKGTCNHQDAAGVGEALPDALQYFRIAKLKEMGGNAYRTAHGPPTPALLEACDRLGMLVMDENRLLGSDPANLERLGALIRRDRNHPSVALWSIANEEHTQTSDVAERVAATMQARIKTLDPTRPVTYASNMGDSKAGINRVIEVRGWNYHLSDMDAYHAAHPDQPEVGTEQASTVSTRGIYANDKQRGYVSAYDVNAPKWAHTAETWCTFFAARPWLSGGFAWTGFDYRGEPTPYDWPCISSHFGIMDTCGFPKDNFYYYQSWWTDQPVLHLLPHWNWPGREGQEIEVRALSNCGEVELFLNGQSLGRQTMSRYGHLSWMVKYAPGVLSAKGYNDGKAVAETKVETTGEPASVQLTPDRATINADGEDVSVFTVSVADAQGRIVPVATNHVEFDLSGPGRIIGVGNGDPSCHEPDVFVARSPVRAVPVGGWRWKLIPDARKGDLPEIAEQFDDSAWTNDDVQSEWGPLDERQSGVFRAQVNLTDADLGSPVVQLNFGMIDDNGWVYVNGKKAGITRDWQVPYTFDIKKFLHAGTNTIAVAVQNLGGSGGVNKGVELQFQEKPVLPQWSRSVFNGLAQVLVQSTREPGVITLTARADGLAPATVAVTAQACSPRPFVP